MILEKKSITLKILREQPITRCDGNGHFLNAVKKELGLLGNIDFNSFDVESWTRCRRKVLEDHTELDMRTRKTRKAQIQVMNEMLL